MPNKHPHDPEFTQEEWDKCQAPLIKVDPIVKEFAEKYGFHFLDAWPHDWPGRELWYKKKSLLNEYYLAFDITLQLDSTYLYKEDIHTYNFTIGVITNYGPKELYKLIFFLRKKCSSWKHLNWCKLLGEFKETIDPERLKQLLEEAKQILDNFDESWLKEMKRVNGIGSFVGEMEK